MMTIYYFQLSKLLEREKCDTNGKGTILRATFITVYKINMYYICRAEAESGPNGNVFRFNAHNVGFS